MCACVCLHKHTDAPHVAMHVHKNTCLHVHTFKYTHTRTRTHTHAYTRLNTVHTAITHALTDIIIIIVVIVNAPAGNCTYIRCITSDELQGEHTVTLKSLEILSGLLLYTMNSIVIYSKCGKPKSVFLPKFC